MILLLLRRYKALEEARLERIAKMREEAELNNSDFKDKTNKELKALLDEKGIEYDAKAKKEDLVKLLEGAE